MNELNPKKSTENNPVFYLDGFEGETTKCLRSAGYASHDLFSANIFKDTAAALKVRIIIFSYFFPLFMLFPTFILFPTFSYFFYYILTKIYLFLSLQVYIYFLLNSLYLLYMHIPLFISEYTIFTSVSSSFHTT